MMCAVTTRWRSSHNIMVHMIATYRPRAKQIYRWRNCTPERTVSVRACLLSKRVCVLSVLCESVRACDIATVKIKSHDVYNEWSSNCCVVLVHFFLCHTRRRTLEIRLVAILGGRGGLRVGWRDLQSLRVNSFEAWRPAFHLPVRPSQAEHHVCWFCIYVMVAVVVWCWG